MALLLASLLAQDFILEDVAALARAQAADGSWATSLEETGRSLSALAAGGWTDLSRDEVGGVAMGDALRRGLTWLAARQREDGLFIPDDPGANAWAAFALVETYAWTSSARWKVSARRAAESILGMPAADEEARTLQAWVLGSARASGLLPRGVEPDPEPRVGSWAAALLSDPGNSGKRHRRSEHEAWRIATARLLKDAPRSLRLFVVMPRNCRACRNVFGND